jgi:hypothetical protein
MPSSDDNKTAQHKRQRPGFSQLNPAGPITFLQKTCFMGLTKQKKAKGC